LSSDFASVISEFFARVRFAGLLLPDGWFGGRAMDGLHQLTFVAQRPKRLLLELDDHLLFSFSGHPIVLETTTRYAAIGDIDETPTLVIKDFSQCVLEYLDYGRNERPHERVFLEGEVLLVAPT
jgi:hypothetical protein